MEQFADIVKIKVLSQLIATLVGDADGRTPNTVFTLLGEYHTVTPLDLDRLADDICNNKYERWIPDINQMTIGAVFAEVTHTPNIHKSIYRLEK